MKIPTFVLTMFAGILGLGLLPSLDASVMDRKTIVTFGERVEIPTMILEPGEYVIKRPSAMNPDVVQFLNGDETRVFATVFALPVYRDKPSDKVEFTFEERPAGAPQALKEWFYPGNIVGSEFVYPKDRQLLARVTELQTPWSSAEDASDASSSPNTDQEEAETSQEADVSQDEEVEIAQATPPPAQQPPGRSAEPAQPAPVRQEAAPAPTPQQEPQPQAGEALPQTASSLPLSGLLGALAISLGIALRRLTQHAV